MEKNEKVVTIPAEVRSASEEEQDITIEGYFKLKT